MLNVQYIFMLLSYQTAGVLHLQFNIIDSNKTNKPNYYFVHYFQLLFGA